MADSKISDYAALGAAPASGDLVEIVDVSDTSAAATGTNKKITAANLLANVQPLDDDLTAIAALTSAANKVPYSTGAQTWALADFTAAGRALVDDANAAAQLVTLGAQAAISGASLSDVGTPASGDLVLLQDVSDSGNLKTAAFSTFGGGGGGSFDPLAADVWFAAQFWS